MRSVLFVFALLAAACGQPSPVPPGSSLLTVHDGWASPTPGGVDVSGGFITISNDTAEDDRLLTVSSPRASRVEIHEMAMEGAVMRMRPVEFLAVPAGGEVSLQPGGLHLMFFGVTQPFTEGEEIPVTLRFERAGEITASLPVRRPASGSAGR